MDGSVRLKIRRLDGVGDNASWTSGRAISWLTLRTPTCRAIQYYNVTLTSRQAYIVKRVELVLHGSRIHKLSSPFLDMPVGAA